MKMLGRLGAVMTLRKQLALNLALLRDPRVPMWLKVAAVGGAAFTLSPLNILGDIPFIGVADDVAMLGIISQAMIHLAPKHVVEELRNAA